MSKFVVAPVTISEIKPHPNADRLEIAMIEGLLYQVVVGKDNCQAGDVMLYVPLDAVIPEPVSDHWNVTQYLSKGKVRAARLRGETSSGFLAPIEAVCDAGFGGVNDIPLNLRDDRVPELGEDVAWYYGIEKFVPPIKIGQGEQDKDVPGFPKYTDIENLHNYPELIEAQEPVVVTEKIHGCLHRDSKVRLVNGEESPMSEISVGDQVLSYDEDSDSFVEGEVEDVVVQEKRYPGHWMKLTFDNGRDLICTEDHKILTRNRGWVTAADLSEDDDIVGDE